jgi:molecular chaperone HscB
VILVDSTLNYFDLFAIEAQFALDLASLAQTYQSLQKTVHPDRFAHGSDQEKLLAVQKSSQINDAYQVLKDPIKRSEHLLTCRGIELPPEQASFGDTRFLMVQMELREMLEEIKHASDIDSAFFEANQTLDVQYQQLLASLASQLDENTEQSNILAAESTRKLKFYQKLYLELERLEDKLFD